MSSINSGEHNAAEHAFLTAYTGYFDNKEQSEKDSSIPFSSKLHMAIQKPEIGERCFFVREQTDVGGGMHSRLKVAQISMLEGSDSAPRIVAKHFEFTDPAEALKRIPSMSDDECREWIEALDVSKDMRPVPSSGDVEFNQNSDGHYEVDISYTGCQAGGKNTKTEIKAKLSTTTWTVHAKISSMPSEEVIRDSVLLLEKKQQQW